MAEAVGALGLVASIIQLSDAAIDLYGYLRHVKNARREKFQLSQETSTLLPLLENLQQRLEAADPSDPWITSLEALGSTSAISKDFKTAVQRILKKVHKGDSKLKSLSSRFTWRLDKAEIRDLQASIERLKSHVILALEGGHLDLSRAIKDDTINIKRVLANSGTVYEMTRGIVKSASVLSKNTAQILAETEALLAISETSTKIHKNTDKISQNAAQILSDTTNIPQLCLNSQAIDGTTGQILQIQNSEAALRRRSEFLELRQRLCPLDFGVHYTNARDLIAPGTGQWFISSAEFRMWANRSCGTMFATGIEGAGKTLLSALNVDKLKRSVTTRAETVLFAFCNYQERQNHTVMLFLAGLLKQVIRDTPQVRELADWCHGERTPPSLSLIRDLLYAEMRRFKKTYVIIDGIDEMRFHVQEKGMRSLIAEIRRLQDFANVFVTSRPSNSLEKEFDQFPGILKTRSEAQKSDIAMSVQQGMLDLAPCVRKSPELQQEILDTVVEAANGMFLYARLQMEDLADKFTPKEVRATLSRMSDPHFTDDSKVKSAFDTTIRRIGDQSRGRRDLAIRVLTWVVFTEASMTLHEIQHALAIEPGDPKIDLQSLYDSDVITAVCGGLVGIDASTNRIHLVHYTAQEYLFRNKDSLFLNAQHYLTECILAYLSMDILCEACAGRVMDEEMINQFPLLRYATLNLGKPTIGDPEISLQHTLLEYICNDKKRDLFYEVLHVDNREHNRRQRSALHLAVELRLHQTVKILISMGCDITERDSTGWQSLHIAAANADSSMCRLLLGHGANANESILGPRYGTAIQASKLRAGDVHFTPLSITIGGREEMRKLETVRELLDWGANPSGMLQQSVREGQAQVTSLLLQRVAYCSKVAAEGHQLNDLNAAVVAAAERGDIDLVRQFIKMGADIEAMASCGDTEFTASIYSGNVELMQVLVDLGANTSPLCPQTECNTNERATITWRWARARACLRGELKVVLLLMRLGADPLQKLAPIDFLEDWRRVSMLHAAAIGYEITDPRGTGASPEEYKYLLRAMTHHFTAQGWLELGVMSKDFGDNIFFGEVFRQLIQTDHGSAISELEKRAMLDAFMKDGLHERTKPRSSFQVIYE
ncbi:MAG: hypothetical protein Q9157_002494 [Trypethelium eluteriae]